MADEYLNKSGHAVPKEEDGASARPEHGVERFVLPHATVPVQDTTQARYSYVPPQPQASHGRRGRDWFKPVGVFLAGCFTLNIVMGLILLAIGSLAATSCVPLGPRSRVGDSDQTTSFITARESSKRDLDTFDALRGSIDALYTQRHTDDGALTPDQLRHEVENGSWPDESAGYGDPASPTNPQLWVRLAELAEEYLERETDEDWAVLDFAYPFSAGSLMPTIGHDEDACVTTRLVCREGEDTGLVATVDYWRWEQPARFSHNLEEARAKYQETFDKLCTFEELELVRGRKALCSDDNFYLWSLGDDDPLCDPATFVSLVNEANERMGAWTDVTLLAADASVGVRYKPLGFDYPNDRPFEALPYEDCREACLRGSRAFAFESAYDDELLTGYASFSESCELDDLYGTLEPSAQEEFVYAWRQHDAARLDESLVSFLLPKLSGVTEDQIIAISETEAPDDDIVDAHVWLVVPRGALPEDAEGFCDAVASLREDLLEHIWHSVSQEGEAHSLGLHVHYYVIDEDSVRYDGRPISFSEMRALAKGDLPSVENCTFEVLLSVNASATLWGNIDDTYVEDISPYDVEGSIAEANDW